VATFSGTDQNARTNAQALAAQQDQADQQAIRQRNAEGMAALQLVLRTTTVDPGKVVGGQVLFALPKAWRKNGAYPIKLEISAGGMTHVISGNLTRK